MEKKQIHFPNEFNWDEDDNLNNNNNKNNTNSSLSGKLLFFSAMRTLDLIIEHATYSI